MAREAREVWAKRVAQWQASGETAKEFATANCLNVWTLRKWREKLARESRSISSGGARGGPKAAGKSRRDAGEGALAFVEVISRTAARAATERLEIVGPGGVIVRVPDRFEPQTLQRLLAALEGR
jgi:hypothetical protein